MSVALELAAWRFIAAHRVGSLRASPAQFIDGDNGCHINTPSCLEYYASAAGASFGEAAIKLAITLGMPCPSGCEEALSAFEVAGNSAPTATRHSGVKSKNSRGTRAASVGSTTAATGAALATGESATPQVGNVRGAR